MKRIKQVTLFIQEDQADKMYEVDLCQISKKKYIVNYLYGRRGGAMTEGTKTVSPVSFDEAQKIFDSVVVSKKVKGYQVLGEEPQVPMNAVKGESGSHPDEEGQRLLLQLNPHEQAIVARLKKNIKKKNYKQLCRTIWRIGEMRLDAAVPLLIPLIQNRTLSKTGDLIDYCLAWALGRCQNSSATDALLNLYEAATADHVKRMAREALLSIHGEENQGLYEQLLNDVRARLPESILKVLEGENPEEISNQINSLLLENQPQHRNLLYYLYVLSLDSETLRRVLIPILLAVPLQPNTFISFRQIFKAAEFRLDAEVFGIVTLRFEKTKPGCFKSPWGSKYVQLPSPHNGYVKFPEEITRQNTRIANSDHTRNYLRRRSWRTLRRLAQLDEVNNHEAFAHMAEGVLSVVKDEHADSPKESSNYRWQRDSSGHWRHQLVSQKKYGPFASLVAFNNLLYKNSTKYHPSSNGLSFVISDSDDENDTATSVRPTSPLGYNREEAFPHIWDRYPEILFKLLITAQSAPVHRFAARALLDNKGFLENLTPNHVILLLKQLYTETLQLGFHAAKKHLEKEANQPELVKALLFSNLAEARQYAEAWLNNNPDLILSDPIFVVDLLTCPFYDIRAFGRYFIARKTLSDANAKQVIVKLLVFLLNLTTLTELHQKIIEEVTALFTQLWDGYVKKIEVEVLFELLKHPLPQIQVLGTTLLIQHDTPAEDLPPEIISSLITSESAEVRGQGVRLFSQLPASILVKQLDLIFSFCVAEQSEVRSAALPLVQRVVEEDASIGNQILEQFLPYLFRKESAEGLHADIQAIIEAALSQSVGVIDKNTRWRLLQAQSKGAQTLGAYLLGTMEETEFSVRQWARLGRHALSSVRQWARNAYQAHPDSIKAHLSDALRIMDTDWDDSRAFAIDYFKNNMDQDDWTPNLLVGICDSVREDIQRLGRDLIMTFFEDKDGAEYLLKLSEHPSGTVQLFSSSFLEQHAKDNLDHLKALTPFFIIALSRVNRGRVAKTRIIRFLDQEARKSKEAAEIVSQIFYRQSATMAIGDKAAFIEVMRNIALTYPDISTGLAICQVPKKAYQGIPHDLEREQTHGV